MQMPHALPRRASASGSTSACRQPGDYGVGMRLPADRRRATASVRGAVRADRRARRDRHVLGWRDVPTDNSPLGPTAQAAEPVIRQVFIGQQSRGRAAPTASPSSASSTSSAAASRTRCASPSLTQARHVLRPEPVLQTIIYKGMLNADQLAPYFPDLHDPAMESALALVHSRFSTNTFPTWARAHPYRYIAHNGEINTLRGNVNWMTARESLFASELFGDDMKKLLPIIDQSGSDSAMFDNALELLVLAGRSLPHAVMMMIPEPWSGDATMSAGEEGVLRVPLLPDGAVGRPGLDRLHRRPAHRRRARPQRPAAVALLRHQGRPGHHGVRGRRPRHRRRSACCTRAGCSRAACSWSISSRAASSPTTS